MSEEGLANLGLELVRITEAAALAAGRWMGLGNRDEADRVAVEAATGVLSKLDLDAKIVVGEDAKHTANATLAVGQHVCRGGPEVDLVVDALDGRNLLAHGYPGAIAVVGLAPRGTMWAPRAAEYAEKIVVERRAAHVLVPECLDAPAAWTLALIARALHREVSDLVVFVLDRPRHVHLIEEIRRAGARVMLRTDGDIAGALMAMSPGSGADVLMGIGGLSEGIVAACAVKALGGGMLGRLAPQSAAEREAVQAAGLDVRRVVTADEMIASNQVFFAATGITDGPLLAGVRYRGSTAETESLLIRGETHTRRRIWAEHRLSGV